MELNLLDVQYEIKTVNITMLLLLLLFDLFNYFLICIAAYTDILHDKRKYKQFLCLDLYLQMLFLIVCK